MMFVVKECLSAGLVSFSAGAASLDGVLFGKLLFDISRERFGEDSSGTGIPEATAHAQCNSASAIYRVKSPHTSRVALVKQFETQHLQCAACFDAGASMTTAVNRLPVSRAANRYFHQFRPLTRV
jgi:hypothetical protein